MENVGRTTFVRPSIAKDVEQLSRPVVYGIPPVRARTA